MYLFLLVLLNQEWLCLLLTSCSALVFQKCDTHSMHGVKEGGS